MRRSLEEIGLAVQEKHRRKTIAEIDKAFQKKHRRESITENDNAVQKSDSRKKTAKTDYIAQESDSRKKAAKTDHIVQEKYSRRTIAEIDKVFQEKHSQETAETNNVVQRRYEQKTMAEIDSAIQEKIERQANRRTDNRNIAEKVKKIHYGEGNKSPSRAFVISEVIFYVALIAMVLCTGLFFSGNLPGRMIGNSHFLEMLTPSMESVYPKGSLLIVGETPAKELNIGDDISYVKDTDTIVTHRIVQIKENYDETGERAFVTRGVDNPVNDPDAVLAKDVLGRVNNSIPLLGAILSWVAQYLLFILVAFLILTTCSFGIQIFWHVSKRAKR